MIAGERRASRPSTRVFDLHLSSVRGGKAKAEKQVRLTSLRQALRWPRMTNFRGISPCLCVSVVKRQTAAFIVRADSNPPP
jgi:hypothetical protein